MGVLLVMQMWFFPSEWAERGPVAETEVGTVGNGRGGVSFLIFGRLAAGLAGGGFGSGTSFSFSATSSSWAASGASDVPSFARFMLCSP